MSASTGPSFCNKQHHGATERTRARGEFETSRTDVNEPQAARSVCVYLRRVRAASAGAPTHLKMTPLSRSVIASLQYQELLQTCHELFHIALAANALSRRDARWYQGQLLSAWGESWQTRDEYLADSAEYHV